MARNSGPITECGCVIRESNGVRSPVGCTQICLWACELKAEQTATTGN